MLDAVAKDLFVWAKQVMSAALFEMAEWLRHGDSTTKMISRHQI